METPQNETINLNISYKSNLQIISLSTSTTFSSLRHSITELTNVDPNNQKLLPTPKPRSSLWNQITSSKHEQEKQDHDPSLSELGFKDGIKILVLGPQNQDLEKMKELQEENEKRNAPRNLHPSLLRGTKPRSTIQSTKTIFHSIQVHPSTPKTSSLHSKIHDYLKKLSKDPAIQHICLKHSFQVGILTELLPHENPNLLGLNENKGSSIKLRIRVDDYESKGLRDYKTTRKVLIHELTHNEFSDHDNDFKTLNSLLCKEVEEFELKSKGERIFEGDFYQPIPNKEKIGNSGHTLSSSRNRNQDDSFEEDEREERRIRILRATLNRLAKEEAEIEVGCGNSGGPINSAGRKS